MGNATAYLRAMKSLLPDPLGDRLEPHARLVNLRPGQIVIGHQDRGSDVFVVIEGLLRVDLHSLNGREIILADIGPGEIIGEFAALDEQPRSASVTAIGKCVLACIPGETFRQTVLDSPETAGWMAERLVKQIRLLTERIYELNALAVSNRLHCELLRLSLDAGIEGGRALIAPAPTHFQLAARIGTHREAVTRELQYLSKEKIVTKEDRNFSVNDIPKLADMVRAVAGDMELVQRAYAAASA